MEINIYANKKLGSNKELATPDDCLHIFSTTEKIIGIDKDDNNIPVYEKIITGNMPNTQNTWVDILKMDCNIKNVKSINGVLDNTFDHRRLNINTYESSNYNSAVCYLQSTDYLQIKVAGWTNSAFGFTFEVTIQYTKSTD